MKNLSVPAGDTAQSPSGGVKKYSMAFTWPKQIQKALEKKKYRAIHLARTNPDYQLKHPNECRDNPDRKVLTCCHPEAEKRILEEHEKMLRLAVVPSVERPKRMNRLG